MNLRACVVVVVAVLLTACASQVRTPDTPAPSTPAAAPVVLPAPTARETPPVQAPAEPGKIPTRVVSVEEIARVKHASAAAHPHDHKKFNRADYLADPASYLKQVAGSRVYEVANPAADVDSLTPEGPTGFSAPTNGEVTLAAKTEPGCPTTFVTFGLGEFPASGFQSITVAADEHGIARTQFRITPGTVGNCLVMAGSPVRANTLSFLITVSGPK